uniref:Uncharacterized protein n=1 Tax=Lepeophtheirus salmonis TaxID=72036 RepID=A0A0K2UB64_LEPSM
MRVLVGVVEEEMVLEGVGMAHRLGQVLAQEGMVEQVLAEGLDYSIIVVQHLLKQS